MVSAPGCPRPRKHRGLLEERRGTLRTPRRSPASHLLQRAQAMNLPSRPASPIPLPFAAGGTTLSRMSKRAVPAFFDTASRERGFRLPPVFNDSMSSKTAMPPCTAHRPPKNRFFQRPVNGMPSRPPCRSETGFAHARHAGRSRRKPTPSESGFSLIELMVALAIISVVLVGVVGGYINFSRITGSSIELTT
ncbi:MAG TPA: prepilin-type N-terminal cleavage/methylation domain-containing protein, partial [Thiotrichales bacterium]|nr:prepilin-type N-terminal cleavage/methylation domain-containing protein [Thiotrichales bacterium]